MKIEPGSLVLDWGRMFQDIPCYGFILPSEHFAKYFEREIGQPWPEGIILKGKEQLEQFTDVWGPSMPADPDGLVSSSSENIEHRILPYSALDNEALNCLGVWYLGGVLDHRDMKTKTFVVAQRHLFKPFQITDLPNIFSIREATFEEAGTKSRLFPHSQDYALRTLYHYFKGGYSGKDLGKVEYDGGDRKVVSILRESGFKEEGIQS